MWTKVTIPGNEEVFKSMSDNVQMEEYAINDSYSLRVGRYYDCGYSVYYVFIKDHQSGELHFMCNPHGEFVNGLYYGMDGNEFLFAWGDREDQTIVRMNLWNMQVFQMTRVDNEDEVSTVAELMYTTQVHLKEWFAEILGTHNFQQLN